MESVLSERRHLERLQHQMQENVPLYVAQRHLIEEVAGFKFHRGVLGCGHRPSCPSLRSLMESVPQKAIIVVCVGIQDPENLGGVIRTCAAFGVQAVLLGPSCADPFYRRVVRTSMGANLTLPLVESRDLKADLLSLRRDHGARLVATVLDAQARPLSSTKRHERTALLLGGEGFGLEPEWIAMCDHRVTIPMSQRVDSLNVSVAAGICLYHFASSSQ